jgi:hypothetical protein
MADSKKLVWDKDATREFESGVSQVALFPMTSAGTYDKGIAWSGVTGIDENPSGADATDLYADDIKYATLRSAEKFDFTISAFDYPDEWGECDGSAEAAPGVYLGQQGRKAFGLVYKTKIGDDTHPGMDKGFKIHVIYNSTASPSSRSYATINENPDAITFSWSATSTPTNVTGYKAVSTIVIDSTKVPEAKMTSLLEKLYGSDNTDAAMQTPDQIINLLKATTSGGNS